VTPDDRPALADRRGVPDVYRPAEDSALLAAAAVETVDAGDLVFEVGVGSGWVAERVAAGTGARVVGDDLTPEACAAARDRGVEVVRGNLLDPVADGAVDVVLCNPPYLPTPAAAEWDDPLEAALSGGPDGRRVVDPFLGDAGRVLAPGGAALLLVSTLTDPEAVRARAAANGLAAETVREASYPYERLLVLRLTPDGPAE
jgi:release factor glutamine methyltransferase